MGPGLGEELELALAGGAEPVVGQGCVLHVEVVTPEGHSLGVLSLAVAAGTPLPELAENLAEMLEARFQAPVEVRPEPGGVRLALGGGFRFGSVSRAFSPSPERRAGGGKLELRRRAP